MAPRGFEPPTPRFLRKSFSELRDKSLTRVWCSNQAELRSHVCLNTPYNSSFLYCDELRSHDYLTIKLFKKLLKIKNHFPISLKKTLK